MRKDLAWNILCHLMLLYTLQMAHGFQWLCPAVVNRIKIFSVGRESQARPITPPACKPSQNSLPKVCFICWSMAVSSHSQFTAGEQHLEEHYSEHSASCGHIKPPTEVVVSRGAPQAGSPARVRSEETETEPTGSVYCLCTVCVMPSLETMPWQQRLACTLQ